MHLILPTAVFLLMVSIGMSLVPGQFISNLRQLTPLTWVKLIAATFIIPPLIALVLGNLLPLERPIFVGLYLIAVAPGAPLMTRNVARRGFDMQMAASYQVWGALLTPVMIPLLVAGAGWLYGRNIWIPPGQVLGVIVQQQFAPLVLGMLLMRFAPEFSTKARRALNLVGNGLFTVALIFLLVKSGSTLRDAGPWPPVAAVLLATGCMVASLALLSNRTSLTRTLVVSNVNRHVGLALLIFGNHFHNQRALPVLLSYAFAAPLVMWIYAKFVRCGSPL
jgi:BASS family bile acid:Na+ symporter